MNISLRSCLAAICLVGVSGIEAKRRIEWPTTTYNAEHQDLTVNARTLSRQETIDLFSGRGHKLLGRKPIIPIEVSITNHGETSRVVQGVFAKAELLDRDFVADRLYTRSYKKIVLWAVAGGFCGLVGGSILGSVGIFALTSCMYGMIGFEVVPVIFVGGLAGATTGYPVGAYLFAKSEHESQLAENKAIKKKISKKIIDTDIVIKPGHTYTGYLFTKDYETLSTDFSVAIV